MEDELSTLEDDIARRTGQAVRQRREAAGLSLRALASRSGVSPSMISDIERGTKSPTITTLVHLAQALGVSAAVLVDAEAASSARIRILRRDERAHGDHPTRWENLGPAAPGSRIDFVRLEIPPGTDLGPAAAHAPGTVEHMHVASGAIRITVGDEVADLGAGDSCTCRTDVPHCVENRDATTPASVYLILERG